MNKGSKNVFVLIVGLCVSCIGSASDLRTELESLMYSANCNDKSTNTVFYLDIMGRSFPVSNEFRFRGVDLGAVVFRRLPIRSLQSPHEGPDISGKSVAQLAAETSAYYASIYYIDAKRHAEDEDPTTDLATEIIEWKGLKMYVETLSGGRVSAAQSYSVVIRVDDSDAELTLFVGDLQVAADIVACVTSP